ncbi:hypothetical protein [Nocardioides sp. LML1-1-1.1]|uniref:hypothetical protein n=1 Tax=Nocardioides sp. LML1-1-1.1 TaxID=3135248 RepID=UPI0034488EBD
MPGLTQQQAQTSAGGDRLAGIRSRHEAGRRAGQGRRAELGRRYVDDVGFLLDVIDQAAVLVRRVEGVRDFALAEAGQAAAAVDQLEQQLAEAEAKVERLRAGLRRLMRAGSLDFHNGEITLGLSLPELLALLAGGEGR